VLSELWTSPSSCCPRTPPSCARTPQQRTPRRSARPLRHS
jgi:hypothetical protein